MTSKQEQQTLAQAQIFQQQMQIIVAQKEAVTTQKKELENAIAELKKTTEKEVYKVTGPVLIKESKSSAIKDLNGKIELANIQIKRMEANEKKIKEKIDELVNKLKG